MYSNRIMKKYSILLVVITTAVATTESFAQGFLQTEYMTSSAFRNEEGERVKFGSGDLLKVTGRYNIPLSVKQNDSGQPVVWTATVSGAYGILDNSGDATDFNPDKILNAGINLSHVRPISEKWSMVATLGGGIYSEPNAISFNSILINGGVIFLYRIRPNFDIGIGAGLTNAYGLPVIMPMVAVSWRLSGKYEVKADVAGGLEISGAMRLNDRFKLRLIAMEMDGMSAVMKVNGESMIYATAIMKSWVSAEYRTGRTSAFYLGAGSSWMRSATLSKRSLKDFFRNLFDDKNEELGFSGAGYFTIGFKYGF